MLSKYLFNKCNICKVIKKFISLELQKRRIIFSIPLIEKIELNCKGKKMTKSGHFRESWAI